jgi:selenide, water dikinase
MDALIEAKTALVGGHSIRDTEVKFGLCVNGTIHPDRILRNNSWKADELLVLTKPIGVGIMNTAGRAGMAPALEIDMAVRSMEMLNKSAAEILAGFPVSACTDVTGFGLLGHACEMAMDNPIGAMIDSRAVHFLPHIADYAEMGLIPAGAYQNLAHRGAFVGGLNEITETMRFLLFDPQTSGGLLASVSRSAAKDAVEALRSIGLDAAIVGYTDISLRGLHVM